MYGHPPPLRQTPELYFQSVQEGGGRPTLQNSSSLQKSENPKTPQVSEFLETRARASKSKNAKFLEFPKIQNSKNSNPSFGFLETRAGASKPKYKIPRVQIPRVSKNPKIPTQVSVFGNSNGSLKIQNSCSRSSFRKSKTWGGFSGFLDFRKLERELDSSILRLPLEFPKIQALGWVFWNPKFLEFPKIQKSKIPTQVSDFWKLEREPQNPKFVLPLEFQKTQTLGWNFLDFWIFGNSRNFGFLDFEAPARVSKNPKLGLEFLEFWIFGNSRNFAFLDFQASRISSLLLVLQ